MMIKQLFLAAFIVSFLPSSAHSNVTKRVIRQHTDTIYYHFYNDVQMIEIDYNQSYMRSHAEGIIASPMGGEESFNYRLLRTRGNIIIFRHRNGEIVKTFNDLRENPTYEGFKKLDEISGLYYHDRDRFIPHRRGNSRYKLNGKYAVSNWIDGKKLRYSLIDSLGNTLTDSSYTSIYRSEGKFFVDNGKKQTVLNDDLTEFISPKFDMIIPAGGFTGNYYILQDSLWGLLDSNGNTILEPIYTRFYYEQEFLVVSTENFHGVLTPTGEIVVPIELSNLIRYSNMYIFSKDDKYGLMNLIFRTVVKHEYDLIQGYQGGRDHFQVKQGEKWGLMHNKTGKLVIACINDAPVTHMDLKLIHTEHK